MHDNSETSFDVDSRFSRIQTAVFTLGVSVIFVLAVVPVHLLVFRLFCILVFWSGMYHHLLAVELRRLLDLTRERHANSLHSLGVCGKGMTPCPHCGTRKIE